MKKIFDESRNCWRVDKAARASVIVDAENYFRYLRQSMAKARHRIILLGWDFDARVEMHDTEQNLVGPLEIGRFVDWLVDKNPDLHIYILRWDTGAIKSMFRGRTLLTLIRWRFHPRIHLKLDRKHPVGAAQHQKVVVVDDDTAFCGGIDITDDRWDTRSHDEEQPCRTPPNNKDGGPWHDAAMAVQGPVAKNLSEFALARWSVAGGTKMVEAQDNDCWPHELKARFENVDVAISRTQPEYDDKPAITEIEKLYLDLIASAKRHIYAESQYFASRKIAIAIAKRLKEKNGPEIVIVNPVTSEGWLEPVVMDSKRARLVKALMDIDHENRLRIFHALNAAGSPIYIHAKLMIIDDRIIRVGSSNMNNRSLGFDTECDLALDAGEPGNPLVREQIANVRNDLLAEHLGTTVDRIEKMFGETDSLIETIQLCRSSGTTLRDYQLPDLNDAENFLAENDVLDPHSADDNFAGLSRKTGRVAEMIQRLRSTRS
ncbi:phospholipase D-like domain-containing protein [Parasphingorhabdus sp.]|uniref:phospholipase D-like domain-containing protein n=1 Tax=Parasphingorhabdus sp. TaxID=2709688 RepID=UPI003C78CD91